MPTVHCSHCGSRLNVPATLLGKRGKCPKCQQKFEIQLPPSTLLETPEDGLVPLDEPAPRQAMPALSKATAVASIAPPEAGDDYALSPLDDPPPRPAASPIAAPAQTALHQAAGNALGIAPERKTQANARPRWLLPAVAAGGGLLSLVLCGGAALWMIGGLGPIARGWGLTLAKTQEPLPGVDSTVCPEPLPEGIGWKVVPDGGPPPQELKSAFPLLASDVRGILFAAPPTGLAATLHPAPAGGTRWVQYDLRKTDPVADVTVEGISAPPREQPVASLSPAGDWLAVADQANRQVVVCSADGRKQASVTPVGDDIRFVVLASEQRLVVLSGQALAGYDVPSGNEAFRIDVRPVGQPVVTPGRKWIACFTGQAFVWHSTQDGSPAGTLPLPEKWFGHVNEPSRVVEHSQRPAGIAIHPSGSLAAGLVLSASGDLQVAVWNLGTGRPVQSFRIPHAHVKTRLPTSAIWCGQSHLLLTSGHLLDLDLHTHLVEHEVESAAGTTPDGRCWRVYSAPSDQRAAIAARLGASKHVREFQSSGRLLAATTLPDEQFRAALAAGQEGFLWHPNMELRVEVDSTVPAEEREKTAEALAYRAAKLGHRVRPEARFGLHIGGDVKRGAMYGEMVESYGPTYGKFEVVAGSVGQASVFGVDAQGRAVMGAPSYEVSRTEKTGGEQAVWREIRAQLGRQALPRLFLRDKSGKRILLPEKKALGIDGIVELPAVEGKTDTIDHFALPEDRPPPVARK